MKHLPKHLQPRWRYLAVEIESTPDAAFDREAFQRACWYAAGNLLGDPGSADADLSVLRFRRPDGLPDGAGGDGRAGGDGADEGGRTGGSGAEAAEIGRASCRERV